MSLEILWPASCRSGSSRKMSCRAPLAVARHDLCSCAVEAVRPCLQERADKAAKAAGADGPCERAAAYSHSIVPGGLLV